MLLDCYRNDEKGQSLLDGVVIVQKLHHILALNRLDFDSSLGANVDNLFHYSLHDTAGSLVAGSLSEGAAADRAHSGECGIDQEFAPACANEIFVNLNRPHHLQKCLHIIQVMVYLSAERAQRECQAVGRAGEFAAARLDHCGTPGHSASEHALFAYNLGDFILRNTVLQGDNHSVILQIVLQKTDYFLVL